MGIKYIIAHIGKCTAPSLVYPVQTSSDTLMNKETLKFDDYVCVPNCWSNSVTLCEKQSHLVSGMVL